MSSNHSEVDAHCKNAQRLHQMGNYEEALTFFSHALSLQLNPEILNARGAIFLSLNQFDAALNDFNSAIQLNKNYIDAWNNRGVIFYKKKQLEAALESFNKAITINNQFADAWNNKGTIYCEMNQLEEALHCFNIAIQSNPNFADAWNNRGAAFYDMKNLEPALENFNHAIALYPHFHDAWNNRGAVFYDLERFDDALKNFKQAATIQPNFILAIRNQGNAYREKGELENAIACYTKALLIKPDDYTSYTNRADLLHKLKRIDEAIHDYLQAQAFCPPEDLHKMLNLCSTLAHEIKRLDEASIYLKRAMELAPQEHGYYFNKSLFSLLLGHFDTGWEEYEARLAIRCFEEKYKLINSDSTKKWQKNASIENETLLIYAEQGFGDIIQFFRYISIVKKQCSAILFWVPGALKTLFQTAINDTNITIVAKGESIPGYTVQVPLLSIPHILGTTVETIPNPGPYLFPDPEHISTWQQRLGTKTALRVGLAWSGSRTHKNDSNRSIPLEMLTPLLGLPYQFYVVQPDVKNEELTLLENHSIHDMSKHLHDFSDTAALISQLDIIISVDTSVAHLAGAMGKPVWILVPFMPDWRWMLDRDDSPWYPSARLFRQAAYNNWSSVIMQVQHALTLLNEWMWFQRQFAHTPAALATIGKNTPS